MSVRTSDPSGSDTQSGGSKLLKIQDPITGMGIFMAVCTSCGKPQGLSIVTQMITGMCSPPMQGSRSQTLRCWR